MKSNIKYDVFISYSREDKETVYPFVEQINKALELECWIDLEGIESGEQFENVIIKAIDECKVVLFMLSDSSLKSEWTKREVYYAEGEGKRIVPVLVKGDKLRGWFKFHFGNVDFIDVQSEEQKEKLIRNLKNWLNKGNSQASKDSSAVQSDQKNNAKEIQCDNLTLPNNHSTTFSWYKMLGSFRKHGLLIVLGLFALFVLYCIIPRCSSNKNALTAAQRDSILAIPDSCFHLIRVDSLLGYANESGGVVIPAQWKYADEFCEGLARVVDGNDRYGFIDKTGALTISYQWKFADKFQDGLAHVVNDSNKWGCIDKTGKEIIQCNWKYLSDFDEDGFSRVLGKTNKYGYIDKRGQLLIPCKWTSANSFINGLAWVRNINQCGLIDKTGKVIIPLGEWNYIFYFSQRDFFQKDLIPVEDYDGLLGYVDKTGNVVIPCQWDQGAIGFSEGLAPVLKNGKWGFIDETGKLVIPYQWLVVGAFHEGLSCVKNDQGFGYIDKTGKIVISNVWRHAEDFKDGLALVQNKEGRYGFIDITGAEIIPCQWKSVGSWNKQFCEGLARVSDENDLHGFIDKTGSVVSCQWKYTDDFCEGLAVVKDKDDTYGFIDKSGTVVISCQWSYADSFNEGLALVKDANGRFGFINTKGELLIPCQWETAHSFKEGMAAVRNDYGEFGYIDKAGKLVVPYKWSDANNFYDNRASVKSEDGRKYEIDKVGNVLRELED